MSIVEIFEVKFGGERQDVEYAEVDTETLEIVAGRHTWKHNIFGADVCPACGNFSSNGKACTCDGKYRPSNWMAEIVAVGLNTVPWTVLEESPVELLEAEKREELTW